MKSLDDAVRYAAKCTEVSRGYMDYVAHLLAGLDFSAVERFASILQRAREQERAVFIAGNGGSAATASHFANDLAWGTRAREVPPMRAISLAANVPVLTALANDAGYENAFVEQMRGLFRPGDVLVAISASGNSENVLRAVQYANEQGGISVGLVGFDGGKIKTLCRECIHVETNRGEYCPVEDVHLAICHAVTTYLRRLAAGDEPARTGVADSK